MLRKLLDKQGKAFEKGGKFEKLYPLYEAIDTFLYTPGHTAKKPSFVRDAVDLKRLMFTVVIAMTPAILFGIYNAGLQANMAMREMGLAAIDNWQTAVIGMTGLGFDPDNFVACFAHGLAYYLPILIVTFAVGGFWEVLFAAVRKHEVNEGFFVTGMLIPMLVPATIPLWQVAIATSFGIVIGKEVFGGVGYNILNPALTARAFLFFAYPGQISGNSVWVAVDGFSSATPLAMAAEKGMGALTTAGSLLDNPLWYNSFVGFIPGSLGETSVVAALIGAFILIVTGVASWRIMISVVAGAFAMSSLFNVIGSDTNPMMAMPFTWHLVLGGFAFGTVFMATDPVTAPVSNTARVIYGFLIGVLVVLVRTVNPAYPEGMMLSILLMNVFAPLIDYYVVKAHKKKRMARYVG
ncbi:MAG: NADH:ubiquinone reductase (Na(+)-transporting) subunit B [Deltaproteobacteria bacterium]|nr:NADH:ubiquinone reductase (Na(+)-transporting) subunit B [Deltaproteobacteria bacterium]MBN2674195.1 NADH:ubiquinone reductase (Na(+)-transporting) subunit B [Deltaproteobacteria bacterium]